MNFYEIKREVNRASRTAGLDEIQSYVEDWINAAWERITEIFVIPSLEKTANIDSVADQNEYLFPYDYKGSESGLMYLNRRLDPIFQEHLMLAYERRSGNRGRVEYYDWHDAVGSDLLVVQNCTLTNGSDEVLTSSTNTILDADHWVRFDPYEDETNADANNEGYVDPQDFGYQIDAGNFVSGTSFKLLTPYRGPSGDQFTVRVRPAEQQQFITYGTPSASETDAFQLVYTGRPKRLYNDSDVPEWPDMGRAIAYMAISLALEYHHSMELSKTFWARAVSRVRDLENRRNKSQALVTDLSIGSTVGRQTGLRGIWLRSSGRGMYGRTY